MGGGGARNAREFYGPQDVRDVGLDIGLEHAWVLYKRTKISNDNVRAAGPHERCLLL
jgi:hypothetical protein